jgi:hypothetical protein
MRFADRPMTAASLIIDSEIARARLEDFIASAEPLLVLWLAGVVREELTPPRALYPANPTLETNR